MNRTTLLRLASAFTLLALGGGCDGVGPDVDGLSGEIAEHRGIWNAREPAVYTYEVERQCFCGEAARGPVRVSVEDGVVVSRVYSESELPVADDLVDLFPSVDGLFDILQEAVARPADHIEVTWDPDTGAPATFFIDYSVNAADEEVGYRVVTAPS